MMRKIEKLLVFASITACSETIGLSCAFPAYLLARER